MYSLSSILMSIYKILTPVDVRVPKNPPLHPTLIQIIYVHIFTKIKYNNV